MKDEVIQRVKNEYGSRGDRFQGWSGFLYSRDLAPGARPAGGPAV